jgi:aspartyl/asparaginyl beta-hydroxylase (cupin superfamily)
VTLTSAEAESILRAGAASLQAGDAKAARASFERLLGAGVRTAQLLLMQAYACKGTGDAAAEEAALDAFLQEQPNGLRGLILKGDCRARARDSRAATRFYKHAVQVGKASGTLPADLAGQVKRIEAWLADADARYASHLEAHLARAGIGPEAASPRFRQSLDIMAGRKQVYLQQPGLYYFPELPQKQFYDRGDFPWLAPIEAATDAIREELGALMREAREDFQPYIVSSADQPRNDYHGLTDNPDWSSLYLWNNGKPVEENAARCPRTIEALSHVPMPHITTRAPVVMFSWLKAGARIPPHSGAINTRLIGHLPLIVPDKCGLRVGNETRSWERGKALVFDDTIEHEAWNDSDEDRVVLIFDIWRPELSEEERRSVVALFEAVDSFEGSQ